jgi:hypothetical protein
MGFELILVITIVLAAIISLVFFRHKMNNDDHDTTESFQNNNRKDQLRLRLKQESALSRSGKDLIEEKCYFDPKMVDGGFYSPLACKDHCTSVDNRNKWGGEYCTKNACEEICSRCEDTSFCRWNKTVFKEAESQLPEPIKLEYKKDKTNLILIWEKPISKDTITNYSCVITDPELEDQFEVELPTDLECEFCEHIIRNLDATKIYHIELYSRNRYGYSRPSNLIRVQVDEDATMMPHITDAPTVSKTREELEQDRINLLQETITTRSPDDIITPLDILAADKKRDGDWLNNYNAEVFF